MIKRKLFTLSRKGKKKRKEKSLVYCGIVEQYDQVLWRITVCERDRVLLKCPCFMHQNIKDVSFLKYYPVNLLISKVPLLGLCLHDQRDRLYILVAKRNRHRYVKYDIWNSNGLGIQAIRMLFDHNLTVIKRSICLLNSKTSIF